MSESKFKRNLIKWDHLLVLGAKTMKVLRYKVKGKRLYYDLHRRT